MDHDGEQEFYGIDDQVPFAPVDLLAGVISARSPFPVVFTGWLSMIAAPGLVTIQSWGARSTGCQPVDRIGWQSTGLTG